MTAKEAKNLLGNRATWELRNMKRALLTFPILNTKEENERLIAVKILLANREKSR